MWLSQNRWEVFVRETLMWLSKALFGSSYGKRMEWNGMYLSKGKEWEKMELNGKE